MNLRVRTADKLIGAVGNPHRSITKIDSGGGVTLGHHDDRNN